MKTEQMKPVPMNQGQLDYVKEQIKQAYLYLISHTTHDSKVVEVMKLAALAVVRKRHEAGDPW